MHAALAGTRVKGLVDTSSTAFGCSVAIRTASIRDVPT